MYFGVRGEANGFKNHTGYALKGLGLVRAHSAGHVVGNAAVMVVGRAYGVVGGVVSRCQFVILTFGHAAECNAQALESANIFPC